MGDVDLNARLDTVLCRVLHIRQERITDTLGFGSIADWDSLGHVALMNAIETTFGIEIDDAQMLELRSVGRIRAFLVSMLPPNGRPWSPAAVLTLCERFLRGAEQAPGAAAVALPSRCMSYGEMLETATRWASAMVSFCPSSPKRVGIYAGRDETAYLGILAALFAGAAYVPLSPALPARRTAHMIDMGTLDAILVSEAERLRFSEVQRFQQKAAPTSFIINCDLQIQRAPDAAPHQRAFSPAQRVPQRRDGEAYVLFTSGSTGVPKCVPIHESNVNYFLNTVQERYEFAPHDRFTQLFDLTFDLSVFDLFAAWGAGACVCVPAPLDVLAPYLWLEQQRVTVWFSVPSVGHLLMRRRSLTPGRLPTLRWSLFCGEAMPARLAQAWQAAAPQSMLENLYGPTELTIACSSYRWVPERSPRACVNDIVPIGALHPGHDALVVNEHLEEVPSGADGELCVAGPQAFMGYGGDAEANGRAFLVRDHADGSPKRYVRTGDRVRDTPDGFVYLGRLDSQLKVRGHRVEASEVEAALCGQPNISQAAVLGHPQDSTGHDYLVAWVAGQDIVPEAILEALRDVLPGHMVPRRIHAIDRLPLTANGKVDRQTLRERMAEAAPW